MALDMVDQRVGVRFTILAVAFAAFLAVAANDPDAEMKKGCNLQPFLFIRYFCK